MRPKWGWQRCGCVVVSVCLVSWVGLFAGCEKAGDGGQKAQEAPPSTTPPTTTPPTTTPPTPTPPAGPVVSITLAAGATSLSADGVSSTTITAQLVTSTNAPAPDGTEVSFSTDLGRFNTNGAKSITAAVSQGSGMVTVPFISEAGIGGTATIVARVQSLTQSLQISLILPAPLPPPPGPVVGLTLDAAETVLRADGASSTTITASVLTSTGDPAPDGTLVAFTTDLGRFTTGGEKTFSAPTSQGTGTAVVPFISEPGVVGTATVVASVGNLTQSLQITFAPLTSPAPPPPPPPGRIVSINLTADPTVSLLANGSSSTTLEALLVTSSGAPAPDGTVVTFTTDLGRFTTTSLKTIRAVTKEGTGTAVVPLISEPNVIGTATVVATVAGLTQSIQISFTLTPPPTPPPTDIAGLTLSTANDSLVANGISSTTITAALITSTGVPVPDGVLVTFTTALGRFTSGGAKSTTARTGGGMALVPFISEEGVFGTATIVASAGAVTQSIEVELLPPSPILPSPGTIVGIRLTAESNALVANGTSSTIITAELVTFTGNPAPDGVTVNFITDKGRFSTANAKTASATTTGGTGRVLVPFISEAGVVGTATVIATVSGITQSIQIALTGAGAPAQIILLADATVIPISGTTVITAEVLDDQGNYVTDGTAVNFATNLSGTGVTPVATTTDGVATATFSAGISAGVATVTATSGSASASLSITIQAGAAGSLDFVSADPVLIGVRGSALPQTSTITFRARDVNGNPVADGTPVTFTLISGLGGGEMVAPTVVGTVAGLASTVLTSGTVSGPVRVLASITVGTTTLTSSSTNVSIAGGAPSGAHIGVAPAFLNIAGLVTQGIICPITAIVGDRFGNPVPQNTTVSFFTNGGVITPQGLTDALGNTVGVEIKTGSPIPRVGSKPDPTPSDPRTGFVTVIAVTQGEETFIDSNGNGIFDGPGEFDATDPEIDTPEPFIDQVSLCNGLPFPASCPANPITPPLLSRDGQFDPNNRFELFIDADGDGVWDIPNGEWDRNKPIFDSTTVLFTGPTRLRVSLRQPDGSCSGDPNDFTVGDVGDDELQEFCLLVSDPAGRPLVGGTEIKVEKSGAGTLLGSGSIFLPDIQQGGPGITFFTFKVAVDPTDEPTKSPVHVTVSVVSPIGATCPGGNGDATVSFSGTVTGTVKPD